MQHESVAVIEGRLSFTALAHAVVNAYEASDGHAFGIDDIYEALYFPFALDFGPPSLGQCYVFIRTVEHKLKSISVPVHFCQHVEDRRQFTNSIFLMGAYCILRLKWSSERTWALFGIFEGALESYIDATPVRYNYGLPMRSCFNAMEKARFLGWIDLETFDYHDYAYHEQVEHGDWNWIIPGRLLSCASPTQQYSDDGEIVTHPPAYYIEHFQLRGITAVVRLNKIEYDAEEFTKCGFTHQDLYFNDGTTPPWDIVEKFLHIMETNKAVAVHCKQGLGRTGTLNCCYIMKHFDFTADEAIAHCRLMRPGSVVGPQQHYLHAYPPPPPPCVHEYRVEARLKAMKKVQMTPQRRQLRPLNGKRKSPEKDLMEDEEEEAEHNGGAAGAMAPAFIPAKTSHDTKRLKIKQ